MTYYSDYPNEPIGGGNPYYRCQHCGVSDPEINGRLEGHRESCEYRLKKEAEVRAQARREGKPVFAVLAIETNPSYSLTQADGTKLTIDSEHPFEAVDKVVIVHEVLGFLKGIAVVEGDTAYWEQQSDAFSGKLMSGYVEKAANKALDDFLRAEQANQPGSGASYVSISLEFSH